MIALILVQIFFSSFPILGKIALSEVTPLTLASFRVVFGALLLTIAARVLSPENPPLTGRDRITLLGLSLLGIVANQCGFISGLSRTTATHSALVSTVIPVFTVAIEVVFTGRRPGLRRLLGIPVALSGVLFLLLHGASAPPVSSASAFAVRGPTLLGDSMIVFSSLCYSIFLVAARPVLARRASLPFTASVFRYGTLPILLLALPDLRRFHPAALSPRAVLAILGIVVLATALAYALNSWALARTDASTTAVYIYIQPVLTATFAAIILAERPGLSTLLAALVIFTGVALTTWNPSGGQTGAIR
jgi:drug/metabolite transporter (DMT)-like permease